MYLIQVSAFELSFRVFLSDIIKVSNCKCRVTIQHAYISIFPRKNIVPSVSERLYYSIKQFCQQNGFLDLNLYQ